MKPSRTWVTTGLALAATVALTALILALAGYPPVTALGALVQGSVGSASVFQSITLVRAVPLILTGLAVALAFRAGLWNIGAEGQLYAGATASVAVALALPDALPGFVTIPIVLLGGALAGVVWASVPVFLKLRAGVGEVITTLLMNFVAINLSAWLVHGPMQEARKVFPQSDAISDAARLPTLIPGTRLHLGFAIAVLAALGLWAFLKFTSGGFVVRALGANPEAARVAGRVNDRAMIVRVFLMSGALAGLAGAVEITGVTFRMYEGISPDYGYTAIAVALLAGLNPLAVIFTGTLFGALEGGAGAMQRVANVPAGWVSTVVALTILTILAADRLLRRREHG